MAVAATLARSSLLMVALTCGSASAAQPFVAPHLPARQAFVKPAPSSNACMGGNRLASHVAYLPDAPTEAMPCGHLLSTDTVLTVHHWDRT